MFTCQKLPFDDLGFIQQDENLWIKFTDGRIASPHFAITTTINPVSMTFVVKNILLNETISTNSYNKVKEFVISAERENKLKKLID